MQEELILKILLNRLKCFYNNNFFISHRSKYITQRLVYVHYF